MFTSYHFGAEKEHGIRHGERPASHFTVFFFGAEMVLIVHSKIYETPPK